MHPDWQQVKQLLLVSLLLQDSESILQQILPLIQKSLPQVSIAFLGEFPEVSSNASSDTLVDASANIQISTLSVISLSFPFSDLFNHANSLIELLKKRSFDAAIVLTSPGQSPYLIGYCCYLAGIPVRVGQSSEFGGGVLSHWIKPPIDPVNDLEYQLHLLRSVCVINDEAIEQANSALSSIQSSNLAMI